MTELSAGAVELDGSPRPTSAGRLRRVGRAPVVAAALTAGLPVLLSASPALALVRDNGDDPGSGLAWWQTLLDYVVVPVGGFLLLAVIIYAVSKARGHHYVPGRAWSAQSVWFGGPEDVDVSKTAVATQAGGGARARW